MAIIEGEGDLKAQSASMAPPQSPTQPTVMDRIVDALDVLTRLANAQNVDESYAEALKTQSAISFLGEWSQELDAMWREATVEQLDAWRSPRELEEG